MNTNGHKIPAHNANRFYEVKDVWIMITNKAPHLRNSSIFMISHMTEYMDYRQLIIRNQNDSLSMNREPSLGSYCRISHPNIKYEVQFANFNNFVACYGS